MNYLHYTSNAGGEKPRRMCFFAHALESTNPSTKLINDRLLELGRAPLGGNEEPGFIRWLTYTVGVGAEAVEVHFYVVPVLAPRFFKATRRIQANGYSQAYNWVRAMVLHAIAEAERDGVELLLGFGALTKPATEFGKDIWERELLPKNLSHVVSSHHGDPGTVWSILTAMMRAGFKPGFKLAVVGANGSIGDAVSRAATVLEPSSILLVGKPDAGDSNKNLARLEELAGRVRSLVPSWQKRIEVLVSQDKHRACLDHRSNVVVFATSGMDATPDEIPPGCVVFDPTTPSACNPLLDWQGRLVLTAGCCQIPEALVPNGFGTIGGRVITDFGMGERVMYGCASELMAKAYWGWRGHLLGQHISLVDVMGCDSEFRSLRIEPQPWLAFGELLTERYVRSFVAKHSHRGG